MSSELFIEKVSNDIPQWEYHVERGCQSDYHTLFINETKQAKVCTKSEQSQKDWCDLELNERNYGNAGQIPGID